MGLVFKDDSIAMIFCLNYNYQIVFDARFETTVGCVVLDLIPGFVFLAVYSCTSLHESLIVFQIFYFCILSASRQFFC